MAEKPIGKGGEPESELGRVLADAIAKVSSQNIEAPRVEAQPSETVGAGFAYPYFNRYYLWANQRIVRLIFGSSVNDEAPSWQMSFALDREIAAELVETLQGLLKDTEPEITNDPKP